MMERLRWRVAAARTALRRWRMKAAPLDGYAQGGVPSPFLDGLPDEDLAALNNLLPWSAFTADGRGRRFGAAAWGGKRSEPQVIPDRRAALLDERFGLKDKTVLEAGCFEGIHTVGLCRLAKAVTAVDGRVENVAKTLVRCGFYGAHPTVFLCDLEAFPLDKAALSADVVHHVGVLYHLADPVRHLREIAACARVGILLDTHVAGEGEAREVYAVDGKEFRYKRHQESGRRDPFSGLGSHAKWLLLEDVTALLKEAGFSDVDVVERRAERNGPRVLVIARRGA